MCFDYRTPAPWVPGLRPTAPTITRLESSIKEFNPHDSFIYDCELHSITVLFLITQVTIGVPPSTVLANEFGMRTMYGSYEVTYHAEVTADDCFPIR